jgi:F0F1-type ATP synthase assembly protein I
VKNLSRTIMNTDDALGRGMDFAIGTLVFFGAGFALDRWLGTTPLFMIGLVVVGIVGQFARAWYGYERSMRQLEAERLEQSRSHHRDATEPAPRSADADVSRQVDA